MTLFELMGLLRKHLALVIALSLGVAIVIAIGCKFMPDEYTATTTMYVLSQRSENEEIGAITSQELSASQMLTNDVATILRSSRVKNDVAQQFGLDNLNEYDLSITSSTTTRVITLSVTGTDPNNAAAIANALVESTSRIAIEVMQIEAVNVIDAAVPPTHPSGPRRTLYTMLGCMAGFCAAVSIVVIQDMVDTRVRSGQDVEELVGVPVMGHFPALERS